MWERLWREDRIHPIDTDVIDAIEEEYAYPQWFTDAVYEDLQLAKQMHHLHVNAVASAPVDIETIITWPGLIDSYGDRQGEIHQSVVDLVLYWIYDELHIGFENGPEPVLLWKWK